MKNNKVKFMIGGCFAGGTSFLSKSLVQNPKINIIKKEEGGEYNFFIYNRYYLQKGLGWYQSKILEKKINIDHSSQLINSYLGMKRLYKYNKDIKIILILRDRIQRSWAHYRYSLLNGIEEYTFLKALKFEKIRYNLLKGHFKVIKPFSYIDRSNYLKYLIYLFKYFPRKNVLILSSESLRKSPDENFKLIYNFLGIKYFQHQPVSNFSSQYVINRKKHIELKKYFGEKFNYIIEKIRAEDISSIQDKSLDKNKIKQIIKNLKTKSPKIPNDAKRYLEKLFKKDRKRLKILTGYDL